VPHIRAANSGEAADRAGLLPLLRDSVRAVCMIFGFRFWAANWVCGHRWSVVVRLLGNWQCCRINAIRHTPHCCV